MFRKSLIAVLLAVVMVFALSGLVFADATVTATQNARTARGDTINSVVAVSSVVGGRSLQIDSEGSASVKEYPKTVVSSTGLTLNTGVALVTGATRLTSITASGVGTTAGDYVLIYDALSATGTPKFEVTVGVVKGTEHIVIPGGATFSTGVFADSNSSFVHVAITHDN